MYYFENIIEELEKNMTQDIDVKALAQEANMSVYEFRRIFTFITKIPTKSLIFVTSEALIFV